MSNIEVTRYPKGHDILMKMQAVQAEIPAQVEIMQELEELTAHDPGFTVFRNIREVEARTKNPEGHESLMKFTARIIEKIAHNPGQDFFIGVMGRSGVGKSETTAGIIKAITESKYIKKMYAARGVDSLEKKLDQQADLAVFNVSLGTGIMRARLEPQEDGHRYIPPDTPFHKLKPRHYDHATYFMRRALEWARVEKPTDRRITTVVVSDSPAHTSRNPDNLKDKSVPNQFNYGGSMFRSQAHNPHAYFIGLPASDGVTDGTFEIRGTLWSEDATDTDFAEVLENHSMKYDANLPRGVVKMMSASPEAMKRAYRQTDENLAALNPELLHMGEFTVERLESDPEFRWYAEACYMEYLADYWGISRERFHIGNNEHTGKIPRQHMISVLKRHQIPLDAIDSRITPDYKGILAKQRTEAREERERIRLQRKGEGIH